MLSNNLSQPSHYERSTPVVGREAPHYKDNNCARISNSSASIGATTVFCLSQRLDNRCFSNKKDKIFINRMFTEHSWITHDLINGRRDVTV